MLEYQEQAINRLELENVALRAELDAERSAAAEEIANLQHQILALSRALEQSEARTVQARAGLRAERRRTLTLSHDLTSWRACAQHLQERKEQLEQHAQKAVIAHREGTGLEEYDAIHDLSNALKGTEPGQYRARTLS